MARQRKATATAIDELTKIKTIHSYAKELSQSSQVAVKDCAVLVLALTHDLLNNIDPDYVLQDKEHFGRIVEYE